MSKAPTCNLKPVTFYRLVADHLSIGASGEEVVELAGVTEGDFDKPPLAVGVFVNGLRIVIQGFIDRSDAARYGHVEFGDCFDGFYAAKFFVLVKFVAFFWKFEIDDVAELVLCKVCYANGSGSIIADTNPFVFFGVLKIAGKVHTYVTGAVRVIEARRWTPHPMAIYRRPKNDLPKLRWAVLENIKT